MPSIRVLYIDDEINNLNAFKASFRRQYEIYTALSAAEGLQILKDIDIHVILADQKMPTMTGVEFFKSIIKEYPYPTRILLTGYTDVEAVIDAINQGDIYRYVSKPWNELELHNTIINAYDAHTDKVNLKKKVQELEKANEELNRFIYSISHELRSPLVSVMGIINLAKMETAPGQHNSNNDNDQYWDLIEKSTSKLDYYIQKTLEYYKNAKATFEKEKIDFKALINDLIDTHSYAEPGTHFNLNIEQTHDFIGDAFRIEIILGNLISNAIRYQKADAQNKQVTISIKVTKENAQIKIEDNGIGILNDHLQKIFTQFFKAKHNKGTGLGLFIVKEALDKIGGTITAGSNIGVGTTFLITLPNA